MNSRLLFQLIRNTGKLRKPVSETISDKCGNLIHNQAERLERWAEYFQDQFSWPAAQGLIPDEPQQEEWLVNTNPPSESEVRNCIKALKRDKAAGPDDLSPVLFKDGGNSLVVAITHLIGNIWSKERLPTSWNESTIVPIFKKDPRDSCGNHRGVSLISVASKLLASIIIHRLTSFREQNIKEQLAGFHPGRGCIDHVFTQRNI